MFDLFTSHSYAAQVEKKMYRFVPADDDLYTSIFMPWRFDVAAIGFRYRADYDLKDGLLGELGDVRKVNVEIDNLEPGGGHGKGRQVRDRTRDKWFRGEGWEIFRFPLSYFKKQSFDAEMIVAMKKELGL